MTWRVDTCAGVLGRKPYAPTDTWDGVAPPQKSAITVIDGANVDVKLNDEQVIGRVLRSPDRLVCSSAGLISPVSTRKNGHLTSECSLTCDLDRNLISNENTSLKAELLRTQKRLDQSNLNTMNNLDQINRANHALELKDEEIRRLEKKLEIQAQTLTDYMESNARLEQEANRPCFCDTRAEIASESFRHSTLQTAIWCGGLSFVALSFIYLYFLTHTG